MDAVKTQTYLKVAIENSDFVDGFEWFAPAVLSLEDLSLIHDMALGGLDWGWDSPAEREAVARLAGLISAIAARG